VLYKTITYVNVNLYLAISTFIRKFRPQLFHIIDSSNGNGNGHVNGNGNVDHVTNGRRSSESRNESTPNSRWAMFTA
jgi:hypothetical protein